MKRLRVNPITCEGHGLCAELLPERIQLDEWGFPIIDPEPVTGEAARILELAGAGIAVQPEDPQALARAASWLAEHPDEAAAMGARGREFARKRLRSVQAARLEQVLLDVRR